MMTKWVVTMSSHRGESRSGRLLALGFCVSLLGLELRNDDGPTVTAEAQASCVVKSPPKP